MKEEDEDGDEDAEVEDAVEQHGDGEFAILMHGIDVATDMSGRLKNLKSGFCLVKMTRGRGLAVVCLCYQHRISGKPCG